MRYLRENDKNSSVIMIQVENEVGLLGQSGIIAGRRKRRLQEMCRINCWMQL